MLNRVKIAGVQVMAVILWLVAAAIGLVTLLQVYEASRVVAVFVIPVNPLDTVAAKYQAVAAARVVLVAGAIAWLVGAIVLFERVLRVAEEPRRLAKLILVTVAIELVTFGLATLTIRVLPGLMLRGLT
jgi:hypothetical protein